jgi:hypothetical protein
VNAFLAVIRVGAGVALGTATFAGAAVFQESFDTDPSSRGWSHHGDATLMRWSPETGRLEATWDSTRTNSFFHHPLGTVLARNDDFRFSFTFQLEEIHTSPPEGTFPLAVGLLRRADAFRSDFYRGAGVNPAWGPRNLVEFDYFPPSTTITATPSSAMVSSNNLRWLSVDLHPYELPLKDPLRVEVVFNAGSQTLSLRLSSRGQELTSGTRTLAGSFGDFRVDAISVTSYSGEHQPAGYGAELLARGWIDDLEVEFPAPPTTHLSIAVFPAGTQVSFPLVAGWQPMLERSANLVAWQATPADLQTDQEHGRFTDAAPLNAGSFYRVSWERP